MFSRLGLVGVGGKVGVGRGLPVSQAEKQVLRYATGGRNLMNGIFVTF